MKKIILLIDDDIDLLNSMASYLIPEGFTIHITTNACNALENLTIIRPNLIITDIMMPNIDGYELIKRIRSKKNWYQTPVIFLTAKGMTQDRILGYNLGCNAYLAKPFYPEELIAIINNIFKQLESHKQNINHNIQKIQNKKQDPIFNSLTPTEYKVLILVSKGYTNKEIANKLKSSIRNIEKYVSRLLNKTKTRNRTELTKLTLLNSLNKLKGE
uniref:TctD transcriptional regulator n=1 Tax=Gracilaria spinulosa TaxID=172972 RepID=A0A6C0A9K8_9FLOR|nr:tctD transcriptional regulator [Gracilaria spinulosa]QHS70719.1 tctD transcriptional regulator [Gracilaria spinulosa]